MQVVQEYVPWLLRDKDSYNIVEPFYNPYIDSESHEVHANRFLTYIESTLSMAL